MEALVEVNAELMTSVAFVTVTSALGELGRQYIKRRIPNEQNLTRSYLLECVTQFENIATVIEVVFVLFNYGLFAFYVLFMLLKIWQALRWPPNKSSIGGHVYMVMDGKETFPDALALNSVETVVSLLVRPIWVTPFWLLFDNQPKRGPLVHGECVSSIQAGLLYSSLAEGGATCTLQLVGLILTALIKNPIARTLAMSHIAYLIIVACVDISGSFFNPQHATAVMGGCEHVGFSELIICYWVAPIIGAIIGTFIFIKVLGTPDRRKRV